MLDVLTTENQRLRSNGDILVNIFLKTLGCLDRKAYLCTKNRR